MKIRKGDVEAVDVRRYDGENEEDAIHSSVEAEARDEVDSERRNCAMDLVSLGRSRHRYRVAGGKNYRLCL